MHHENHVRLITLRLFARCSRGFTLVQLVICVAGIMGMMLLLIPALKRQISSANATMCMSNLNVIYEGLTSYGMDNGGWWPERQVGTQAGLIKDSNVWINLIAVDKYVDEISRFTCPGDINAPRRDSMTEEFLRRQIGNAPSYGLNQLTWREHDVAPSDDPGIKREPAFPARTILLADLGPDIPEGDLPKDEVERRRILELARDAGRLVADDGFRLGAVRSPGSWLTARHGRTINLMAMGGNVSVGKSHDVSKMMTELPEKYYDDCATGPGECTFCNVFHAAHYDFSGSGLYWWTGQYESHSLNPAHTAGE